MRHLFILAGLLFLTIAVGCATTRFDWLGGDKGGPPREVPNAAKLVTYLNENSSLVQSVRYDDIDVTITKDHQPINVMATMLVQKPLNFKLAVKMVGKDMADVGSNDQEFWWWNSKDPRPYQYFCSYKDLREGRMRDPNFPIQPEWIIEALGLGQYGPASKYKVEHDAETVRLIESTTSPQGKPIRKVIVFQRRPRTPPQAMVSDFILQDAAGKEICSAHVSEVHFDAATTRNANLPKKIELNWPEMNTKLTLSMRRVTVNSRLPETAFERPRLNGIASFNLATGLQQVGGLK